MDLTAELEETVGLTAEYNNNTVNFTVIKASLTPLFFQNIDKIADYPTAVAGCVRDWDVTVHGEKWGLDEASLSRLPSAFLAAILNRISESWTGEKKSEKSSAIGSAATGK